MTYLFFCGFLDSGLRIVYDDTDTDIDNTDSNVDDNQIIESEEEIVIHISGAVNKAGIVKLKVNSRVADAIEGMVLCTKKGGWTYPTLFGMLRRYIPLRV